MNINGIVQQLKAERDKLDAAIGALEAVAGGGSSTGPAKASGKYQQTSAIVSKMDSVGALRKTLASFVSEKPFTERKSA
jgi:hypothetical protein